MHRAPEILNAACNTQYLSGRASLVVKRDGGEFSIYLDLFQNLNNLFSNLNQMISRSHIILLAIIAVYR